MCIRDRYERFSFIFRNEKNPARLYRIGTFFEYYVSAAKKTYEAAGGRVRFVVRCSDSPLMINARNAAVILTQLSSFLLFHSEDGRFCLLYTSGTEYRWKAPLHCVVLIGYDQKASTVTLADPLYGIVERDMELFETRWHQMGEQAVMID